jgi:hypothetical protein
MSDMSTFTDAPPTYTATDSNNADPSPAEGTQLPMPFCLPQIWAKFDSPFGRGYNEHLNEAGISSETWLKFVDTLNIAMVSVQFLPNRLRSDSTFLHTRPDFRL